MNYIHCLLFFSLCPFFALKATIHPAEAAQLLESAHKNDYAELNRLLNNNPDLLEYAFSSNNTQLLDKIYTIQAHNLTDLKIDIIERIANTLIEKAFAKGDPFRYEFIAPLFERNFRFLLNSFDAQDLCHKIRRVLNDYGYTMSHLYFSIDKNNLLDINSNHLENKNYPPVIKADIINESVVFYIIFNEFNEANLKAIKDTIINALDCNINMIFDLRQNIGGNIAILEELLGLFIPHQKMIALVANKNTVAQHFGSAHAYYDEEELFEQAYLAQRQDDGFITPRSMERSVPNYQGKIAILVSQNTFSAAETFAYALYLHTNATIIGTTTSGQSLLCRQEIIRNTITVTYPIGAMIFPEGICFEGTGLDPTLDTSRIPTEECFTTWLRY